MHATLWRWLLGLALLNVGPAAADEHWTSTLQTHRRAAFQDAAAHRVHLQREAAAARAAGQVATWAGLEGLRLGMLAERGDIAGETVARAQKPGFFDALSARTRQLVDGLKAVAAENGVPFSADSEGGMFGFFLMPELPQNYATVMTTDKERFNRFFHGMLDAGIYLAPALYEAGFVSAAHSQADIDATLAAARTALR